MLSDDDHQLILALRSEADVTCASRFGLQLAATLRFSTSDQARVATAIAEIARNALVHAGSGEATIRMASRDGKRGVAVRIEDRGGGIPNVGLAMREGYSTAGSLGIGLPGARRMMDEFEIRPRPDGGTVVTMTKWLGGGG